jgi:dTDP-4-dehydrorhamnose reductase
MASNNVKILITGASSYVGARLYSDLKRDFDVAGTYHENQLFPELIKLDIRNREEVLQVIKTEKPQFIVHVAANPNARWCEANPEEAIKLNEKGTQNIVDGADIIRANVIYISSFAAIEPANIYGKTKLAGEKIVEKSKHSFNILRPALIIGYSPNTTNDRPFNRLLKNIKEKTPAIYDTSWKSQLTWVGHISEIIKILIEKDIKDKIIPVAVPELKTRFDIAKDILSPLDIKAEPKNDNDPTPIIEVSESRLKELDLPTYSYEEIIDKIVKETKEILKI